MEDDGLAPPPSGGDSAPPPPAISTPAPPTTEDTIVDGGPGLVFMPFVVMEDLLDKLKLLNYEEVLLILSPKIMVPQAYALK